MKRTRILYALALSALVFLVLGAVQARADIYMKQKTHTGAFTMMGQTQPEKDSFMVYWMGANRARTDEDNGKSTIFVPEKKILYALDHNKQTYAEIPMDIDKMVDQALAGKDDAEMAEAKKKIGGLMKGMAKGMMGEMSVKVTETGETKKIGSWNCRKYIIETDMGMGKSKAEAWATEDLKIDYGLMFTVGNAMMAGQPGFDKIIKEMQKVKGAIVYQTTSVKMMGNDMTTTTEIIEFTEKAAPVGCYDVPAGYKKVKGFGN